MKQLVARGTVDLMIFSHDPRSVALQLPFTSMYLRTYLEPTQSRRRRLIPDNISIRPSVPSRVCSSPVKISHDTVKVADAIWPSAATGMQLI